MIRKSKRPKIFYGWWIVGASFLTFLYVGGAVFYGFTAFFEPIQNEMGWSYTEVSIAASLRGLEMGLLAPLVGVLADRWGPRKLIFGGLFVTIVGLLFLSTARSLLIFYAAFVLIAIGVSACTVLVVLTALANWFQRRMGLALGIASSGFGFSGLLVPVIVRLIEAYDWRAAINILALGMLVLILPLSLFFRHRPEQYGYLPDGETDEAAYPGEGGARKTVEVQVKVKQALKSGTFWHLALARMYHMMATAAIITHVMPYLSTIGVSRARSSLVATAIPLMSVVGRFAFGWLGDRTNKRLVATGSFIMIGSGVLCFAYTSTAAGIWLLVPFVLLLGVGYGSSNSLLPSLGREYFGRNRFGSIYGVVEGIGTAGNMIGPIIAGWVYDNWGSYQPIWFFLTGLAVVAVISIFTIKPLANQAGPAG